MLRIPGIPESIAASILPAIIDQVVERYPRIAVHVTQVSTATLDFRELRDRKFDLVIARIDAPLDPSLGEDLAVEKLFDDRTVLATAATSKWARCKTVRLSELRDASWILTPPGTINTALLAAAFKAAGLEAPKPNLVTFSAHLRVHLAASGRFITAIPLSTFRANARRFDLSPASQVAGPAMASCDRHAEGPDVEPDCGTIYRERARRFKNDKSRNVTAREAMSPLGH